MIKLTEDAGKQIMAQIEADHSHNDPLRIAVTKHAQHKGFQYLMGFDKQTENDSLYEVRGVKLIVANDLLDVVKGMEIDFVEIEGEQNQFIFKNPNDPNFQAPKD
jgi:iron-sulfur cluster assembly accessory protein